jgi:amino acid adenylation domain-containing protein
LNGKERTIPRRGPGPARQSMMQQRLWFLEQMDPGVNVFNLPSAYRVSGRLDADALERSLAAIVSRHEALRTTLAFEGEVPVQVIADHVRASIARVDLTALPAPHREAEALRRIQQEANATFDLARGPLFRASLYRLDDEQHVFFFMPHHAVWDGWSFDVFMRELDTHYAAVVRDVRPVLPEQPIQYGDFAEWHLSWLQGEELARQSAYWTGRLQGSGHLELPTDHPRPARRTGRGGFEPFRMSSGQTAALVEVARSCGATPFMIFLAAYCVLLHRLTDQHDFVIGSPVRGRSHPETEDLLGFFVNTLALRIDASGSPSFRELLLRVRTTCIEAFASPDMPFELLVRKLDVPRDPSRTPLFQAFFSFQDETSRKDSLGDLSLAQIQVMPDAVPTELALWLMHRKEGLVGGLSYSTDLFEPNSATRMLDQLRVVLAAVAVDVDRPVATLPVLSEPERTLLRQCNDTHADYDRSACVHGLVARQAAATPHAVAVADESGTDVTYGELVARSCDVAAKLRELGAGRGSRVGVCVERSALLPAVLLGVFEAGAAYVPLDPSFPTARLSFMASDARLAVLVTSAELSDRVATDAPRLLLDRPALSGRVEGRPEPLHEGARPEDPAYVIYTSGSTGTPKGVVVPHRAVVNFLSSMGRVPGLSASDVLVAVTTLSFDIAGLEILLPLVRGARVVMASKDTASNGPALLSLLRRVGATVLQATPSTWRMLVDAGWSTNDSLKALCGGEALPLDLARALSERAQEAWNLYGPTETTIWSTAWRIPPCPDRVLIGRPIANTQCHVVDGRGLEVPIGVPGELCIGGDGVTLGYLGRPEQTGARFVVDPFAGSGRTMYKTGDMVRRLATGDLEYIGRNDHQVKLRGYRIELGEIEARLAEHPAIADACAEVRSRAGGDAYLATYYTLRPGHSVTTTDLRRELRASLPEYMLPQAFVELRELPRTLNGKVDRRALPEPFGSEAGLPGAVAPRTDNERLVARVWCDLVGRREVGVHDNFFDVGGHSLLVLKAISRIAEETGARLGPRSFVIDTLEQLAAQLPASRAPGAGEEVREARTPGLLERLRQRVTG